jgi:hypothetical protein
VEVVATLAALFERERGEGGKVKRRRWKKETWGREGEERSKHFVLRARYEW